MIAVIAKRRLAAGQRPGGKTGSADVIAVTAMLWTGARAVGAGLALVVVASCGQKAPPAETSASLQGAVARAGSVALPASLVAEVARAKGSPPRVAVEELVRDALAAQGSLARGLDRDPSVSWESTAALARRVPEALFDRAVAQGPPTDDELATVSVVHAVVMRSSSLREEDAIALAGAIRQAVAGARSADEFEARAATVAHPHAQVIVQPVGPFGADGLDASGGELDAGFVAAAFALRAPTDMSPIVASPFGWHVIQLVERKAPEGSPVDRAPEASEQGSAVVRMRARMHLDELLRARAPLAKIEVSGAADSLLAQAISTP